MWQKIIWIALAGAFGTLARYGLASVVQRACGTSFPWGTFVVNVIGCFVVGVIWALLQERWSLGPESRTAILVGFMGAFTTFSTFMFETGQFLRDGQWILAGGNILAQNVVGIAALILGLSVGRLV